MSVKMFLANKSSKQALVEWEELLVNVRNSTPVDINESEEDKLERIKTLEKDPEAWFAYYFPKFSFADPAPFQVKSTKKVVSATHIYHVRSWARGLAKSTRRMFEVFFKKFAQKWKINALLISKSEDNAKRLLAPYRANLEANQRLIHDYGTQERHGKWTEEEFVTMAGDSFRAVGAEQNPRGAKLDEMRINMIIFDDVDDDQVCQNIDRLDKRWEWVEKAVLPTVEISRPYHIYFDNNIIAEDSIAVRAALIEDAVVEIVNIRDDSGKSTWKKNSEADIDRMIKKMSYESSQSEYFNDPHSQGKTFPQMKWGKCPPIKDLQFVQIYADPSTSNRDKPSIKANAQTSCKAVFVIGSDGIDYYIYKGFVDVMSNARFIESFYTCWYYTREKQAKLAFCHVENNTLQNPHYEQVLLPLINQKGKEDRNGILPITPDTREKPDKWFRIEGTLEPLNRNGHLILNEEEKQDPHMKKLEAQFKAAKATSKTLDGPDCIEGGVFLTQQRLMVRAVNGIQIIKRQPNNKRF